MMDPDAITTLIKQGLPESQVEVKTDGQGHYEALVVTTQFQGKRSVARHQMVYSTLGVLIGAEIHALALRTYTPEEWQSSDN